MKYLTLYGSIEKNTNKIISPADADWSGMREGTLLRFVKDKKFFTVKKTEEIMPVLEFIVESQHSILVKDTGITLGDKDYITLSFKEYQFDKLVGITNAGSGYKVNDKLTVEGGVISYDVVTNSNQRTVFLVTEVTTAGNITSVSVENKGKYFESPERITPVSGGNGIGAVFNINYNLAPQRLMMEREIERMEKISESNKIIFNSPIPPNVTEGKLSVNKWLVHLDEIYLGETNVNQNFEIVRDYTPNYNFPLILVGNPNPEIIFNQAIKLMDFKLKELESKIESTLLRQ